MVDARRAVPKPNYMVKIQNCLRDKLLDHISDPGLKDQVDAWIQRIIKRNDRDEKRFLICLAIDLNVDFIPAQTIINVFSKLDFSKSEFEVITDFDEILAKPGSSHFAHSACRLFSHNKDQYACVLYWTKIFRKYIQAKSKSLLPPSKRDEKRIYDRFFLENTAGLRDLENWAGWKGIVWVLPYNELLDFLRSALPDAAIANLLIDILGINPPELTPSDVFEYDKLYYIRYPSDFSETCHQPTTLCGYWKEPHGLYLSYGREDGYGRTYANSDKESIVRERVHTWGSWNHDDFELLEIGCPDASMRRVISDKINDAGLARFK